MIDVKPLILFFVVVIAGLLFELVVFSALNLIIGRRLKTNHRYNLGKNISLMSIPIFGVIFLVMSKQYNYAELFLLAAVVGTVAEYIFGRFFQHIEGKRVWTYNIATIGGYTSIFSIPYWGGAGLLFVLVAKMIGI